MDEQRIRIFSGMMDCAPHEPALHNPNNKNLTWGVYSAPSITIRRWTGAGSTKGWCGGPNGIRTRV